MTLRSRTSGSSPSTDPRQDVPEREVVDGVVYVRRPCVECGVPLSVAEASVRVSESRRWPRCTDCIIREARS